MKTILLSVSVAATLLGSANAQVELILNGDFEKTTDPWYGQKLEVRGNLEKVVGAPELLSHETKDTAHKSAGALKVTIKKDPKFVYRSHNSGAVCTLSAAVPAGKTLKITFQARGVEGGSILSVHRLWGGGAATTLLDDTWRKYELVVTSEHDTDGLVFSLVPNDTGGIQELTDGVFLLDNVSVVAEN